MQNTNKVVESSRPNWIPNDTLPYLPEPLPVQNYRSIIPDARAHEMPMIGGDVQVRARAMSIDPNSPEAAQLAATQYNISPLQLHQGPVTMAPASFQLNDINTNALPHSVQELAGNSSVQGSIVVKNADQIGSKRLRANCQVGGMTNAVLNNEKMVHDWYKTQQSQKKREERELRRREYRRAQGLPSRSVSVEVKARGDVALDSSSGSHSYVYSYEYYGSSSEDKGSRSVGKAKVQKRGGSTSLSSTSFENAEVNVVSGSGHRNKAKKGTANQSRGGSSRGQRSKRNIQVDGRNHRHRCSGDSSSQWGDIPAEEMYRNERRGSHDFVPDWKSPSKNQPKLVSKKTSRCC